MVTEWQLCLADAPDQLVALFACRELAAAAAAAAAAVDAVVAAAAVLAAAVVVAAVASIAAEHEPFLDPVAGVAAGVGSTPSEPDA